MPLAELEHHVVEINGSRVSFSVTGEGRPLVLLHGWAGFWERFLSLFTPDLGFRIYGFDMPGWTPAAELAGQNPLCAFADAVRSTFGVIGIEDKAHVMGNSVGALTALLLADRHPHAVDRLILASPPVALLRRGLKRWLLKHLGGAMVTSPLALGIAERTHKSRWYNYWLARWATFYRYDPVFFETVIMPSALACDEQTSLRQTLSLLEIDALALVQRIQHTTAVITGDRDPLVPPHAARAMVELLPAGELLVIPHAKHGIMVEQAHEFRDLVVSFLHGYPHISPANVPTNEVGIPGLT